MHVLFSTTGKQRRLLSQGISEHEREYAGILCMSKHTVCSRSGGSRMKMAYISAVKLLRKIPVCQFTEMVKL